MLDLLIRGATVADGLGNPFRRADVAIADGRIVAVGRADAEGGARRVVEADGLVVAPGFIDMHSHADFTMPAFPCARNSLDQGVTSEVIGNCGYSPAPISDDPRRADEQRASCHGLGPDLAWDWRTFAEYLDRLDAARPSVNAIPLVGHGMLRLATVGADARAATTAEIDTMRSLAADALGAGAWGMSSGLVYPPGSYATTDEITAVGAALQPVDGLYASHIRDENDGVADALREAVEIGRRLGVPVEVSHLKAAGIPNHGRAAELLAILGDARAGGLRVTQDAYPYIAGSTLLTQLLPRWVQDGGTSAIIERLGSPDVRARIAADVRDGLPGWNNYLRSSGGPDAITIAAVADSSLRGLEGLTLARAASAAGTDPLTLVLDTIVADRAATVMIVRLMHEADVEAIVDDPSTLIGSDQLGVTSDDARVHPRAYGTFARVLGRAARGPDPNRLATAIQRMTGGPAAVLGLTDRGRIAPGLVADLVVFDPATVTDASTYDEPTLAPIGVELVVLAGRVAVERRKAVDLGLGRVLRRTVSGRRPPRRS